MSFRMTPSSTIEDIRLTKQDREVYCKREAEETESQAVIANDEYKLDKTQKCKGADASESEWK